MKYDDFFKVLDSDTLYAPLSVVKHAVGRGLFELPKFHGSDARYKARMAINRYAREHFPADGDGLVEEPGHPPFRGWYGWRWKESLAAQCPASEDIAFIQRLKNRLPPGSQGKRNQGKGHKDGPAQRFGVLAIRKWGVLLAVLMVTTLTIGAVMSGYPEGLRILRDQGPRAALEYFMTSSSKRADYKTDFGRAWSRYVVGNLQEAKADCYQLIQNDDLPEGVRANCHYLLGYAYLRSRQFVEAEENFHIALEVYARLQKHVHLFQASLGLGEAAMEKGHWGEAEALFEEAFLLNNEAGRNLGHFFHLKARLAFLRQDYLLALAMSRESLKRVQADHLVNDQADALSDVGFYQILLGAYRDGYGNTVAAQEMIQKDGDERKYYFNLINLLLLQKCKGEPFAPLVHQIRGRIQEEGASDLQGFLDFALEWECAAEDNNLQELDISSPELVGEGSEQPPPD